jgi:hypothetical protein
MKTIIFSFFLLACSFANSQVVSGYFEGPLGTVPIYTTGGSKNNSSGYLEYGNNILKKQYNVYSINFLDYPNWICLQFNLLGFVGKNDVIVVEIVGNCSSSSTVRNVKDICSVGDYIEIDGDLKKMVSMAKYSVYKK